MIQNLIIIEVKNGQSLAQTDQQKIFILFDRNHNGGHLIEVALLNRSDLGAILNAGLRTVKCGQFTGWHLLTALERDLDDLLL